MRFNMKSANKTKLNFFPNKMAVKLNVLGPLMENWVSSNMQSCFTVTKKKSRLGMRNVKILEEGKQPYQLTTCGSHVPIFRFSRGPGDCLLLLGLPRDLRIT
jgi:hypothetical protein